MRHNPIAINHNTVVEYNAADITNGGMHNKKLYLISGKLLGNVVGDVRKQLMDPNNMDFRPKQGLSYIQDDVGPYNHEESKTKYWIPGRIQYKVVWGCVCLMSCGFIYYYAVSNPKSCWEVVFLLYCLFCTRFLFNNLIKIFHGLYYSFIEIRVIIQLYTFLGHRPPILPLSQH